ncbi:hypothetical protein K1X84_13310 [bacterium]|nr:hypothetical protein [bacterium]
MKQVLIVIYLLVYASYNFLQGQEREWSRVRIVTGSAWSFAEGEEYLFLGLQIPIAPKLHTGLAYGYRPQEIKTHQLGVTVGYDLLTTGQRRLYVKSDLSFFYRGSSLLLDDKFFRQSLGLGYVTPLYRKIILYSEVNFFGWYFGRKDIYQENPNLLEAGELKLGVGYKF